jgi:hypothetical protein
MSNTDLKKENSRLAYDLIRTRARLESADFDRRAWKTGFWLMNLLAACYIIFCAVNNG